MKSKSKAKTVLATVAIGSLFGSTQLMAEDCISVKGKIFNNGQATGNVFSTLGVVALNGVPHWAK